MHGRDRGLAVRLDHEHGKLLAAVPRHAIHRAHLAREETRDVLQHFVAGLMAVRVVDQFEMVEIRQHERERMLEPLAAAPLLVERALEFTAVDDAGEFVVGRELAQLREGLPEFARVADRALKRPCGEFALDQIVGRAGLQRRKVDIVARVRGEHDHRRLATGSLRFAEQREPIAVAELVVEEAHRELAAEQFLQAGGIVVDRFELERLAAESFGHPFDEPVLQPVVIHEQNSGGAGHGEQ